MWLPLQDCILGSWQPCGLPLPDCVRTIHHPKATDFTYFRIRQAPFFRAQQAFTCWADLNVASASISASRIFDLNITLPLLCATLLYSELQIRIKNTKILCLKMRSCIYLNSLTAQWFSLKKCRSYSTLTALSILTKGTKIQVLTECFREVRFKVLVSET